MIRPATPTDGAECAAIYAPHVSDGAASFEEVPPDAPAMAERIERLNRTHGWLVDEVDGEIAGYAYACPHRERRAYRWTTEVSVYVAPGHQGTGVGRRLYEALLARLEQQGFRLALAGITLPNDASVALHERLGFRHVGTYERIGYKAGAWRDVGWWQLPLGPAGDGPPAEPQPPQASS